MKTTHLAVTAMVVTGWIFVCHSPVTPAQTKDNNHPNVLSNTGFENGTGDEPAAWNFNHRGTNGTIRWDKTRARTANASVLIHNETPAQSGNVMRTVKCEPPLPAGSRVQFSAYAAAKEASASPKIIVYLVGASGNRQRPSPSAHIAGGTHDWMQVSGVGVADRSIHHIVVYLCHYGTGRVWWDDAGVNFSRAEKRKIMDRSDGTGTDKTVATRDGLKLAFARNGSVSSALVDEADLTVKGRRSGLWIMPHNGDIAPVGGRLKQSNGVIRQTFENDGLGLNLNATFSARDGAIRCRGVIEDTTAEPRGLELLFALPVGDESWRWGKSLRARPPLANAPHTQEFTTFSSVSDPNTGNGIALAVPAEFPCDCWFAYNQDFGFMVRFRFGLSPNAGGALKSRAPFRFVIYRIDDDWGLRDAARRYYALYPRAFKKRVEREGLWMFGHPNFDLPDPENYTFHEGGPRGWEFDDNHNINTCPYIIPGQREITGLDTLPNSKSQALEIFENRDFSRDGRRSSRGWGQKDIINNCMLFDKNGLPQMRIRNTRWGGNSITFPMNASPYLYQNSDRPTIGKVLLKHVTAQHDEIPQLDGTYVDSLGAWGNYENYRKKHFATSKVPLSYQPANGRPMMPNRFTLLEFLWELGDLMHDRNKLLFANGVHQTRRFHFFALDVMGVEGHGFLWQKRLMAYQKPFLLLVYRIHDNPKKMAHYCHLCTFYGLYPSWANMRIFNDNPQLYEPVHKLNDRFVPVLREITSAGWEPVTYAKSENPNVWLERWGPDDNRNLYLTVYNSTEQKKNPQIDIKLAELLNKEAKKIRAEDRLTGDTWNATVKKGTATIKPSIPSEHVRVLRITAG